MATLDINAKYASPSAEDNASKKDVIYTSDSGALYVVKMDENIAEVMGFDDFGTTSIATERPQGLKMRTVSFKDSTGKVSGQLPVGKPTEDIFVSGGTIKVARKGKADGVVCTVIGAQGEKRRILSAADTGQQSGDNT